MRCDGCKFCQKFPNQPADVCLHRCHPIFGLLGTILLVCGELIRAKVTRYTNDEYELFTHVHTSTVRSYSCSTSVVKLM